MTAAARQTEHQTPSVTLPHPKTLADGRQVTIRPIRRDDVQRNAAFLESLSPPSKHFLFLGGISRLSDEQLRKLCDVDYAEDMAFVALVADPSNPAQYRQVGVCRYAGARDASQGAEISVAVADDWQHVGLGKMLLRHLIDYARAHGVPRLYSIDSVYNDRMRKLARQLGFAEHTAPQDPHQVTYSVDLRW